MHCSNVRAGSFQASVLDVVAKGRRAAEAVLLPVIEALVQERSSRPAAELAGWRGLCPSPPIDPIHDGITRNRRDRALRGGDDYAGNPDGPPYNRLIKDVRH